MDGTMKGWYVGRYEEVFVGAMEIHFYVLIGSIISGWSDKNSKHHR